MLIHRYVRQGDLGKVKEEISKGVDINLLDDGVTPLEEACSYGYFEVAEFLLDNDAQIYLPLRKNKTMSVINNCLFNIIIAAEEFYEDMNSTSEIAKRQKFEERYEDCIKIFKLILFHEKKLRQKEPAKYSNIPFLMLTRSDESSLTPLQLLKMSNHDVLRKRLTVIYNSIQPEEVLHKDLSGVTAPQSNKKNTPKTNQNVGCGFSAFWQSLLSSTNVKSSSKSPSEEKQSEGKQWLLKKTN